jgi:hypothetical protein
MKTLIDKAITASFAAIACASIQAQSLERVALNDAQIIIEANRSSTGDWWTLTLKPRWANGNESKAAVQYKATLFDLRNAKIFEREDTVTLDRFSTDARAVRLTSLFGRSSEGFKQQDVSHARITFTVVGSDGEKEYKNVAITRTRSP